MYPSTRAFASAEITGPMPRPGTICRADPTNGWPMWAAFDTATITLAPRRHRLGDVPLDARLRLGGDHRADVAPRNHLPRVLHQPLDDVVGLRHRDHHRCRHAPLAGAAGHRGDDVARRHLEVGVRHD